MAKTINIKFGSGNTKDAAGGKLASAKSVIVPFMKTHQKMPHGPNKDTTRTRTYLHPNERKRRFGTFDKL